MGSASKGHELRRVDVSTTMPAGAARQQIEAALRSENTLLVREGARPDVVIGSPHHAPPGTSSLFGKRVADENAGLFAVRVAEELGARAVVACCARTHDPNKQDGPYVDAVLRPPLRGFLEIHGHGGTSAGGGRSAARFDIEASAGTEEASSHAEGFVRRLREYQQRLAEEEGPAIGALTLSGTWSAIHFKATGARSIRRAREDGAVALHLELPPSLRKERGQSGLPSVGKAFASIVAAAFAGLVGTEIVSPRAHRNPGRDDA